MPKKSERSPSERFQLPPEVSFHKEAVGGTWAYVFRHRSLGLLGRIVLLDNGDGRTRVSCELAGDAADPMTAKRAEVFKPLSIEIANRMEKEARGLPAGRHRREMPREGFPPEPPELIESQLIPCDRCGEMVAMIIYAPGATDAGRFEDYARKMYHEYERRNLPSWIIGPQLGEGPPEERPAEILKVWPTRAPVERLRPSEFKPRLEQLAAEHCRVIRKVVSGGQTGADQAGLRAARAAGIETGGWAPRGWDTEGGPAPWLSEFGLQECPKKGYPARTEANARDSDGTLWFGSTDSPGYRSTTTACRRFGKPVLIVVEGTTRPSEVRAWVSAHGIKVLNVAGNRETKNPGLGERVQSFLRRVLRSE